MTSGLLPAIGKPAGDIRPRLKLTPGLIFTHRLTAFSHLLFCQGEPSSPKPGGHEIVPSVFTTTSLFLSGSIGLQSIHPENDTHLGVSRTEIMKWADAPGLTCRGPRRELNSWQRHGTTSQLP